MNLGVELPITAHYWALLNIELTGTTQSGIRYEKHGYGVKMHWGEEIIDFDFGKDGELTGYLNKLGYCSACLRCTSSFRRTRSGTSVLVAFRMSIPSSINQAINPKCEKITAFFTLLKSQ